MAKQALPPLKPASAPAGDEVSAQVLVIGGPTGTAVAAEGCGGTTGGRDTPPSAEAESERGATPLKPPRRDEGGAELGGIAEELTEVVEMS